jgi:uncharacterized protein YrrD
MTRTLQDCLKCEVIASEEGLSLGRPRDMLIDPEQHRIAVVVLATTPVLQLTTVFAASRVSSFAEDRLAIGGLSDVQLAYQAPDLLTIIERGLHFRGRDVVTPEGRNMGRIVKILVDEKGQVTEYHVAKGFLRRVFRRTQTLNPSQLITSGAGIAVAEGHPKEAEDSPSEAESREPEGSKPASD